jgi:hypothetical protein
MWKSCHSNKRTLAHPDGDRGMRTRSHMHLRTQICTYHHLILFRHFVRMFHSTYDTGLSLPLRLYQCATERDSRSTIRTCTVGRDVQLSATGCVLNPGPTSKQPSEAGLHGCRRYVRAWSSIAGGLMGELDEVKGSRKEEQFDDVGRAWGQ